MNEAASPLPWKIDDKGRLVDAEGSIVGMIRRSTDMEYIVQQANLPPLFTESPGRYMGTGNGIDWKLTLRKFVEDGRALDLSEADFVAEVDKIVLGISFNTPEDTP